MPLLNSLAGFVAAATIAPWAFAQAESDTPPRATEEVAAPNWQKAQSLIKQEEPAANERLDRIKAELAALPQAKDAPAWAAEWAGQYYTGDGRGMNVAITLAPQSGLVYTWHGCMGLYDLNHGDIANDFDGGLQLKLAIDPSVSGYKYMSNRVYFVPWGDRHYLVPKAKLLEMVNNYNEGGFAREHMYGIPLRREDRDKPVQGRPQLPAEYASLLRDAAIEAGVTKGEIAGRRQITKGVDAVSGRLWLDAGTQQGVYVGMEFQLCGLLGGMVKVVEVAESSAVAELTLFPSTGAEVEMPKVGDRLSTRRDIRAVLKKGREEKKADDSGPN
jgi:hypothetical protein